MRWLQVALAEAHEMWETGGNAGFLRRCTNHFLKRLTLSASEDAEEGLDVCVGAHIAVGVEVSAEAEAGGAAVACKTGEEGLDVGVGAGVAITVEVGGAADGRG